MRNVKLLFSIKKKKKKKPLTIKTSDKNERCLDPGQKEVKGFLFH